MKRTESRDDEEGGAQRWVLLSWNVKKGPRTGKRAVPRSPGFGVTVVLEW